MCHALTVVMYICFILLRFGGEIAMGWLFGLLGSSFIPEEMMDAHRTLVLLVPLFTAIGRTLVIKTG